MDVLIRFHACECVCELLVCIKKMRLGYETGYATITLANILHTIAQTAFFAKTFIVRIDGGIVELGFGQMKVECFDAMYLVVSQVLQIVRTTHVRTERIQDLIPSSVWPVECAIRAVYHIGIVTVPKVQFPISCKHK